jgi:uncharacterized membrane protein
MATAVLPGMVTAPRLDSPFQASAIGLISAARRAEARSMRLPYVALTLLGIVLLADLALTLPSLAEPVATHFDGAGNPNGWMSRRGYAIFMVALGIGLPAFIVALVRIAPRRFPNQLSIPHRSFWLAAGRREETLQFLKWHIGWLATLMVFFVIAIHHLVIMANAARPPVLPRAPLFFVIGCFLAGLAVWMWLLWLRFRRGP